MHDFRGEKISCLFLVSVALSAVKDLMFLTPPTSGGDNTGADQGPPCDGVHHVPMMCLCFYASSATPL